MDPRTLEQHADELANNVTSGSNVVIIGDGPMAMIAAIKFAQMGISKITIVGPRLGEFTRSGNFQAYVYDAVSNFLKPVSVKPSHFYHIKDIERNLYPQLENFNINKIHGKFTGFDRNKDKAIVIHCNDGQDMTIKADIVFDCTGARRAVALEYNKLVESKDQFSINPVDDFKSKQFLFVRFKEFNKDIKDLMNGFFERGINDGYDILELRLLALLNDYGWNRPYLPFCALRNTDSFVYFGVNKNVGKVNAYLEVPDGFTEEQAFAMFNAMAKMIWDTIRQDPDYGYDSKSVTKAPFILEHESQKHKNKVVKTVFNADAMKISPGYNAGDAEIPVIITIGDATCNLPFYTGRSLVLGIERFEQMLPAFVVENQQLASIDFDKLKLCYDEGFESHRKHLIDLTEMTFNKLEGYYEVPIIEWISMYDDVINILEKGNAPQEEIECVKRFRDFLLEMEKNGLSWEGGNSRDSSVSDTPGLGP